MRFVKRETVIEAEYYTKALRESLKEMKCLTSAYLRKDYNKDAMMEMMLERFKHETCKPSANKISWRLLDRRQIPEKYKNVPLNSATVSNRLIYKNPEIIDNIHFYSPSFTNGNDTDGIDTDDTDNNGGNGTDNNDKDLAVDKESEISDSDNYINEENKIGKANETVDTNVDNYDETDNSDNDKDHSIDNTPSHKDLESSFSSNLDVISEKVGANSEIEDDFDIEGILAIFDQYQDGQEAGIVGCEKESICCDSKDSEIGQVSKSRSNINRQKLRNELKSLFNSQHPEKVFSFRKYDVINWPEGIRMLEDNWRLNEIEKIRENMHKFIFVKRISVMTRATEHGIDRLGDLNGILDKNMSRKSTHKLILERFRQETGVPSANIIDWKLLDRRDFPVKYDGILINSYTICLRRIFKNPEILNNIHFFKAKKYENRQRKRKLASDDANQTYDNDKDKDEPNEINNAIEADNSGNDNNNYIDNTTGQKEQDSVFSPGPDVISGKDGANTDTEEEFATDGILAMFEKIQDCHDTELWYNDNETLGMGLQISDFLPSNSKPNQGETTKLKTVHEERRILRNELKNLFNTQHPKKAFLLTYYTVINWPEGVPTHRHLWRKHEIIKIRENMHRFIFVKRNLSMKTAKVNGIDQSNDNLDLSMTQDDTCKILLE